MNLFMLFFSTMLLVVTMSSQATNPANSNTPNVPGVGQATNQTNQNQTKQPNPVNPNTNPGQPGTVYQPAIDGTYQVLAYEKFGQVLPGMTTIKVVIRNNILFFPGDTKLPGKMLRLTLGPNNTIMITPLDGRVDPAAPVNSTNTNAGSTTQNPPAGQSNTVNQAGNTQPAANSEWGVYVLSSEFFSIAVTGTQPQGNPSVNNGIPPMSNNNPTNGGQANTPPAGQTNPPGAGQANQNGIIRNPRTGGTDAPGPGKLPPSGPGGPVQPPGGNVQPPGGIIRDPRTGGTDTPGSGQPPPIGPGNGVCSAVLVLRRVAN